MALEVTDIVAGSIQEFTNYAMIIVILMIIYYVIKFFMVAPPTDEEKEEQEKKDQEKGEKLKEFVKGKYESSKREKLLGPARGFVTDALEAAEKIKDDELKEKTAKAVKSAEFLSKKIERKLNSAKRVLRAGKLESKGEKSDAMTHLYNLAEEALKIYENRIDKKIPDITLSDSDWEDEVDAIKLHLNDIVVRCGNLFKQIDKYMDEEKVDMPAPATP